MSYDTTVEVSDDTTTATVEVKAKYANEGVYLKLWGSTDSELVERLVARLDLTADEARKLGASLISAANDSAKFASDHPRFGQWR